MNNKRVRGLLLGLFGVLCLSPDALLVRLYPGDVWHFILLRSLGMAGFIGTILFFVPQWLAGFRWKPIFVYAAILAVGTISFPMAIHQTSVANVVVILASSPLLAAILGIWLVKDPVRTQVWITSTIIFLAVATIFYKSLGFGSVWGDLLALLTAVILAFEALIIRMYPKVSFMPAIALGGFFSALIAMFFMDFSSFATAGLWVGMMNALSVSVAFVFIILATEYLTAPEINLVYLLETVLSPIWIFVVFLEIPSDTTIWAGVVILVTLLIHYGKELLGYSKYSKGKIET